jgi:hypothetical protein
MPFRGKKGKSGMLLFAQPKSSMSLGLKPSNIRSLACEEDRCRLPDSLPSISTERENR